MKNILLPFTTVLTIMLGCILFVSAVSAMLLSRIAETTADIIIGMVVWQESKMLARLVALKQTNKENVNESD
jgi:hypothetical protein